MRATTRKNGARAGNPRYIEIAQQLEREIETSSRIGDYLPSERELHRRFGVTVATVRAALSLLAEKNIVKKLPSRGTLVVGKHGSPIAKAPPVGRLANGTTACNVALVMPLSPYMLITLARGVEPALRRLGLRLMLCGTYPAGDGPDVPPDPQAHEAEVLESLFDAGVCGVLWWSMFGRTNRSVARRLIDHGIPVVLLDNQVPHLACDWVGIDDHSAAYEACRHLIAVGRSNIAFIGESVVGTMTVTYEERLAGYVDAISDAFRNTPDAGSILGPVDDGTPTEWLREVPVALRHRVLFLPSRGAGHYEPLTAMLSAETRPDALYIATDNVARSVLETLQELGLRVPDDVAVVTTGDIGRFTGEPSTLTSIRQPFELMARRAVRLLSQRMREPDRPVQHVHLPTRLIVRQSTTLAGVPPAGLAD